jgi:hypothetical protein
MTSTTKVFTIEPNPHWVIIDNFSKLPNGAAIFTYRSLDPAEFKPAYQDNAGQIPYGQPIVGNGNGTFDPIFWEFDPNNPQEGYYIQVWSAATNGVMLWDFGPLFGGGGGGGGTVTDNVNIENFVINSYFFRNIGNQAGTPSLPQFINLAPSNNAGYVGTTTDVGGWHGGDIVFAKSNTTSSDSLSFVKFNPLGVHALPGQDITPIYYLNYTCTGAGSAEAYKYVQFPIVQGIQNLSNQPMTVVVYARSSSSSIINLTWRMCFGDGSPATADIILPVTAPITLDNDWIQYSFDSTTPDATLGQLGLCGNDALFLQINYPLSPNTCNIDIAKVAVYLGNGHDPLIEFQTNDMIDSIINTPRTGDTRTSLNSFLPGWVAMNDLTIGTNDTNGSSNATNRANEDTFPLFNLIWSLFNGSVPLQALAPMFTSGGAPVAYGASAIFDFTAHNQISLTKNLGRVMAGAGGSNGIGTTFGVSTYQLLTTDLPNHVHISGIPGQTFIYTGNGTGPLMGTGPTPSSHTADTGVQDPPSPNNPISLYQPTVFMNVFMKL